MLVILYATVTPNGLIARKNFDEDFLPDSGWEAFKNSVAETGNFIVGRHTYELIEPEHFDNLNATRVVVSHQNIDVRPNFLVAHSPQEALQLLAGKDFEKALVIGSGISSSFMEAGLVDGLHLYVVPYIIGEGIPIFAGDFESQLELISSEPFAEGLLTKYWIK